MMIVVSMYSLLLIYIFIIVVMGNTFITKVVVNNQTQLNYYNENYFIKNNYTSRYECIHYDDTNNTDEFQNDVYNYALNIVEMNNLITIADVGCGSGYKLIKYFGDKTKYRTIGLEIEPTLSFLRNKYPNYQWESSDLYKPPVIDTIDMIICSDVIEHLSNPDILLNWLSSINFKYLVISTPDREGQSDIMKEISFLDDAESNRIGPPSNPAHMREWSINEYKMYLQQYFNVIYHGKLAFEARGKIYIESQFILAKNYDSESCRCNPENEYLLVSNYGSDDKYIQIEQSLNIFLQEMKKPFAICTSNTSYLQNKHILNSNWQSIVNEHDNCVKIYYS